MSGACGAVQPPPPQCRGPGLVYVKGWCGGGAGGRLHQVISGGGAGVVFPLAPVLDPGPGTVSYQLWSQGGTRTLDTLY